MAFSHPHPLRLPVFAPMCVVGRVQPQNPPAAGSGMGVDGEAEGGEGVEWGPYAFPVAGTGMWSPWLWGRDAMPAPPHPPDAPAAQSSPPGAPEGEGTLEAPRQPEVGLQEAARGARMEGGCAGWRLRKGRARAAIVCGGWDQAPSPLTQSASPEPPACCSPLPSPRGHVFMGTPARGPHLPQHPASGQRGQGSLGAIRPTPMVQTGQVSPPKSAQPVCFGAPRAPEGLWALSFERSLPQLSTSSPGVPELREAGSSCTPTCRTLQSTSG